jgi:hypothetical protein
MRKISAEMPSNLQQSHLGMESNESIALDVATMIGAGCTVAAARRVIGGCVSFMFTASAGAGDRLDELVMRAVSFFGTWLD